MLDRQWMVEQQEKTRLAQQEWQDGQEEKAEQRHTQQLEQLERLHKSEMKIVGGWVIFAIAIITVLGAIMGGAIEAGWFVRWFGLGG